MYMYMNVNTIKRYPFFKTITWLSHMNNMHHVMISYLNKMANVALYSLFLFICLLGELFYYVLICIYDVKMINDNCKSSRLNL